MPDERGNLIPITEGTRGEDTEAFIRNALQHEGILKWAYILHDKEYYNEHDINSRRGALSYQLADGYDWSKQYSSVEEYYEEEMKKPPHPGDRKKPQWIVVVITDRKVTQETVAGWFGYDFSRVQRVSGREDIADQLKKLTREDDYSRLTNRHLYPDEEVKANFDFRKYINETMPMNPALKKLRDILVPANLRK